MSKLSTAEVLRLRAHEALCHSIHLGGAPLRMTALLGGLNTTAQQGLEKRTSVAKAVLGQFFFGTAEAVPFVKSRFPI